MKSKWEIIILFLLLISFISTTSGQQIAFPGAEGYGRFVTGGRGGKVYEVTNLNDSGVGSLRDAISKNETRTIVFRVSGTIMLNSELRIRYGNLTIAGQTAPGDGVCIGGFTVTVDADNVIIRYIRFRLGDLNSVAEDATWGRNRKDIIIDHCTMTWSVDECASFYDNQNFTMQWCIIGESLYNSVHPKGKHGYGGIQGGDAATFHHNLYISNTSRNPRFCGARYHTATYTTEIVDFVNNVIYNWGFNSAYGGELGQQNMRANYFKPGPATINSVRSRILNPTISSDPVAGYGKFFLIDNYVDGSPSASNDNWGVGVQGVSEETKGGIKVLQPFAIADVNIQSAQDAYELVLNNAGANFPKRDALDIRYISEVRNGNATFEGSSYRQDYSIPDLSKITGIIDSQSNVGGWPTLNSLPAPDDNDHDGMADSWELQQGLNPNDPLDGNFVHTSGYTMLEEYINGIIVSTVPVSPDSKNLPKGFALHQNYPNPFNPSTSILFSIPVQGNVDIRIYDLLGREIKNLFNGEKSAGDHSITWNGRDNTLNYVSTGIYFCVVNYKTFTKTIKMLLLK